MIFDDCSLRCGSVSQFEYDASRHFCNIHSFLCRGILLILRGLVAFLQFVLCPTQNRPDDQHSNQQNHNTSHCNPRCLPPINDGIDEIPGGSLPDHTPNRVADAINHHHDARLLERDAARVANVKINNRDQRRSSCRSEYNVQYKTSSRVLLHVCF